METLLLDSANGKNIDAIPEVIVEYFEGKFYFERLKIRLLMFPDAITTARWLVVQLTHCTRITQLPGKVPTWNNLHVHL